MTDPIKELADVLEAWHANKKKGLDEIIDAARGDKPLKLDLDGTEHELRGDMLKGFLIGMIAARSLMGELPFTLEPNDPEDESWDDEAEEELTKDEPDPPRPANFGHFS